MDIAGRTYEYFERVHREVFVGDRASNPNLAVEVLESIEVSGVPTLVLITPWTLNGMVFGDLGDFPTSLTVGAKEYPVFANTIEELGSYQSVNLVPDVSNLESQEAARRTARAYAQPFWSAVAQALEEVQVADPDRRELFRGLIKPDRDEPSQP